MRLDWPGHLYARRAVTHYIRDKCVNEEDREHDEQDLAIPADVLAIQLKPNTAAMIATMKEIPADLSIGACVNIHVG